MELTNIHLEILHFLYKCRYATSNNLQDCILRIVFLLGRRQGEQT